MKYQSKAPVKISLLTKQLASVVQTLHNVGPRFILMLCSERLNHFRLTQLFQCAVLNTNKSQIKQ